MPKDVSSLTVKELIELLQQFDEDLPVVFSYNYGDHWHTTVLGEVNQAQEEAAEWSDYHRMFKLSDAESDDRHKEDESVAVLVLS